MNRKVVVSIITVTILLFGLTLFAQARGPGMKARGPEMEGREGIAPRGGARPGMGPGMGPGKELRARNIDMCLGELDLTSEQIEQLKKIREEHLGEMSKIRKGMIDVKTQEKQYLARVKDQNQQAIEETIEEGSELWKQREKEKLKYREKVMSILTKEQKDKLYICENFGHRNIRPGGPGNPPLPPQQKMR